MKKVNISIGFIGLVYKKGEIVRVLKAGTYWIGFSESQKTFSLQAAFMPLEGLAIALKNEVVTPYLRLLEVKDNEIAFRFEYGRLAQIHTAGSFAFWNLLVDYSFLIDDRNKVEIGTQIDRNLIEHPSLRSWIRVFRVEEYQRGLLFIDHTFSKLCEAGEYMFWNNTRVVNMQLVDMRMRMMEVSGQEVLTRDKASLRLTLFASYSVRDVKKAVLENSDYEKQLYTALQLALRAYIGTRSLDEILENKESISEFVLNELRETAGTMGIELKSVGVRDIILPGEMKDILNRVLIAEKQAQANVIMRREETASTRSLLNTAKLMDENQTLFKLKEMEYIEKIADKIGTITVSGNGQVMKQLTEIFS